MNVLQVYCLIINGQMKYDNRIKTVPEEITEDTFWNFKVYRAALYLSERCWNDTQQIIDRRYFLAD